MTMEIHPLDGKERADTQLQRNTGRVSRYERLLITDLRSHRGTRSSKPFSPGCQKARLRT